MSISRILELHFSQQHTQSGTRRTVTLDSGPDSPDQPRTIFFDLLDEHAPEPEVLDGFLFGIVFLIMQTGLPLHVNGPVSRAALRNLDEYQRAWAMWKPDTYRRVPISASRIVDDLSHPPNRKAFAAFSGGVDSIFTLLRHGRRELGEASYPLEGDVLMVHGFDVPLSSPDRLDALIERTRPLLEALNLRLKVIRTNLKDVSGQRWMDSSMAQLACCMHNYSHEYGFALVGSSKPYDSMYFPSGSNAVMDPMLSGEAIRLVHDGAAYSRTEKVAYIATHGVASRVLKVCWAGSEMDKNCGVCEKCIRTYLNFFAAGVQDPACFEHPLDHKRILSMELEHYAHVAELTSIVSYAQKRGIEAPWLPLLKRRIRGYYLPAPVKKCLHRTGRLKEMLKNGEYGLLLSKIKNRLVP